MKQVLYLLTCLVFVSCSNDNKTESYPNVYPKNKKVMIVGLDGVRSDLITADVAPFLNGLTSNENAVYNLKHKAESLTFSGPNWGSILTGVHYQKHEITDNLFNNTNLANYPHFFKYLNDYYGEEQVNLVSYAHWSSINLFMDLYDYADQSPVDLTYTDQQVFNLVERTIVENYRVDPDVVFVHLDQVDGAGHGFGFSKDIVEYRTAVNNVDAFTKQIFDLVQTRAAANNEDWLFLVVSDHGGEGTDHGGGADNPSIRNTMFFVHNDGITNSGELAASEQVDLVPTIFEFLGIDLTNYVFDGRSVANFE